MDKDGAQRWRDLSSVLPVGISILDKGGNVVEFNPVLGSILGITEEGLRDGAYRNRKYLRLDGTPMPREEFPSARADSERRMIPPVVIGVIKEDGHIVWTEVSAAPLPDPDLSCVVVTRDVTDRKLDLEALRKGHADYRTLSTQLEAILDHLPCLVFYKDKQNRFIRVNKYMAEAYKKSKAELEGASLYDLYQKSEAEKYFQDDLEVLNSGVGKLNIEEQWRTTDGIRWVDTSKIPFVDESGEIVGIIGISMDITERKRSDQLIQELIHRLEVEKDHAQKSAMTDGLTMIPNRRYFDEALSREFFRGKRTGSLLSLVMLDIDHFKKFNDLYGHPAGDDCLRRVAASLASSVGRVPDIAVRYGGEEFMVILPDTSIHGAAIVAERIRRSIEALAIPHEDSETSDYVTVSLGVATVDPVELPAPDKALEMVDMALYRAKKNGRNRFEAATSIIGHEGHAHGGKSDFVRLVWHTHDECGNATIDEQHRELFDTANELISGVLGGSPKKKCLSMINRLLGEIVNHFAEEEKILVSVGFPSVDVHRRSHAELVAKASSMAEQYARDALTIGELFTFLAYEVVSQHMLEEDKDFFLYF